MSSVGLDPEWLTTAIEHDGQHPSSVDFVGFIGTGQMSRNARFSLSWDSVEGPGSVVVKVPSTEPGTIASSFEHDTYLKECDFYQSVQPLVDVAVPKAYAVHFDAEGQDFAVVLEDLAGSEQGDQFTEPTTKQLHLAIEQAAALQAPVWNKTSGPAFASYHAGAAERAAGVSQLLPLFMPAVFERLGAGLDDGIPDVLSRFVAAAGPWSEARAEPTTLVHGDFRPDNFMFGTTPDAPPIAIVDWQTLSLGLGVADVAYLLGGALKPETRRTVEHEMLEYYVSCLADRGVTYPMEQCLAEYAIGSLHGVVIGILATTMADQTERGDALFTLMLNRHGQHALDLGVLDE